MRSARFRLSTLCAISTVALAVAGCSSSDSLCGAGKRADYQGSAYCYYDQAITEEGFHCPELLPYRLTSNGRPICAGKGNLPGGFDAYLASLIRDGGLLDTDGGAGSCWAKWSAPVASVTAPSRPLQSSPAMRFNFSYSETATGSQIVLTSVGSDGVAQSSDGPFNIATHSGSWVELRDAANQTVFTHNVYQLVPESVESYSDGDGGGFAQAPLCPENGSLTLTSFPNLTSATQIVFFSSALDGHLDGPTIELARFTLPTTRR